MLSSLLIIVLSVLPQMAAGPVASAPASSASAATSQAAADHAATMVATTRQERDRAVAEKARLARAYEAQLDELDRLKQQRASWRRDRMIRTRMSESHATAELLAKLDQRIRQLGSLLRRREEALLAAIARERATGPGAARARQLDRWYAAAQRHLRPDAKKIVLPDDRIDPLADPEELEYQAALIRQSEQELAAELARLDQQAGRYRHMAVLRRKRSRAAALGGFGEDRPRRSTGQTRTAAANNDSTAGAGGGAADPAPPPPSSPPESGEEPPRAPDPSPTLPPEQDGSGGDSLMFDIILADVVDAPTLQALRAASRSSDPALKARATERARQQVEERLERLRARRQRIQRRARELHRP